MKYFSLFCVTAEEKNVKSSGNVSNYKYHVLTFVNVKMNVLIRYWKTNTTRCLIRTLIPTAMSSKVYSESIFYTKKICHFK